MAKLTSKFPLAFFNTPWVRDTAEWEKHSVSTVEYFSLANDHEKRNYSPIPRQIFILNPHMKETVNCLKTTKSPYTDRWWLSPSPLWAGWWCGGVSRLHSASSPAATACSSVWLSHFSAARPDNGEYKKGGGLVCRYITGEAANYKQCVNLPAGCCHSLLLC